MLSVIELCSTLENRWRRKIFLVSGKTQSPRRSNRPYVLFRGSGRKKTHNLSRCNKSLSVGLIPLAYSNFFLANQPNKLSEKATSSFWLCVVFRLPDLPRILQVDLPKNFQLGRKLEGRFGAFLEVSRIGRKLEK